MAKKASKKTKASTIPFKTKTTAKFVSFTFGATIPTQAYGNVQPTIEVRSKSYESALEFATKRIEALYEKYAEARPVFMGRITVEEKTVAPKVEKEESSASSTAASAPSTPSTTAPAVSNTPKPPAVEKAEKAISLAMSIDAVDAIQEQIEKSVKIDHADKPALYTLCLKKKKELNNK